MVVKPYGFRLAYGNSYQLIAAAESRPGLLALFVYEIKITKW